jgi:hypothetical protein
MQNPSECDARKRREIFAIELRSRARSDHLYKRRLEAEPSSEVVVSRGLAAAKPELVDGSCPLEQKLLALKEVLAGNSPSLKADALTCLRGTINNEEALEMMCANKTVPILKEFLESPHSNEVEDTTFIICRMTFGVSQINKYLLSQGVVEALLKSITAHNFEATENAIWGITNILVDLEEVTTLLLNKSYLNTLVRVLEWYPVQHITLWRTVAFCLWPLCCGGMALVEAKQAANLIKQMAVAGDAQVFRECIRAVERLVQGDQLLITHIMDQTMIDWVITGVRSHDSITRRHAVYSIAAVSALDADLTQHFLMHNILDLLKTSLHSSDPNERSSVLVFLRNVAFYTSAMRAQLMCHNIMDEAVQALSDTSDRVRDEALDFVVTLTENLTYDLRLKLVFVYDVFRPLSVTLSMAHVGNIPMLFTLCSLLLEATEAEYSRPLGTSIKELFEKSGCLDGLYKMTGVGDRKLCVEIWNLITSFFSQEEDSDEGEREVALNAPVHEGGFNFS